MTALIDYQDYDALGLADLIRKKAIKPEELLESVRLQIEKINPAINAFSDLFFERARADLKHVDPEAPFAGVPFPLKDLGLALAGTRTMGGSRVWKNHVPDFNSTLADRYIRAGLVIFGKTTTPELGLTTTTESVLTGRTLNPWNPAKTSGGSSGGAAAAVAARIIPAAHASDGGGSIRIPAACCGIFGMKPTRGRIPLGPEHMEGWNGCSISHVVSVSVRDSAALMDVTTGSEPGSPYACPPQARPFLDEVAAPPQKLRIAFALQAPGGAALSSEVVRGAEAAARLCEELGHEVDEVSLPVDNHTFRRAFGTIFFVCTARALAEGAEELGRPVTENDVEAATWAAAQRGTQIPAVEYSRSIAAMHQTGLSMARFMQTYDVVLSPVLAKPPVDLGLLSLDDPARYGREVASFSPFTALYNVTGQPSMSVPLHWTPDGLPVGVMFSGRFGDEATLFRLAAQLEQAKPWAGRKPLF